MNAAGGFNCTGDVSQGPLSLSVNPDDPGKCLAGQGVRWDTAQLLHDTKFKCTGAASEVAQTATTSATTVVLEADFYRAGDGNDESFRAKMIVSATDLPGHAGQNIWVEGVGCRSAIGELQPLKEHAPRTNTCAVAVTSSCARLRYR